MSGLVLLFLVERMLVATSSPNYVPSIILLGAFLVPLTHPRPAPQLDLLVGWEHVYTSTPI